MCSVLLQEATLITTATHILLLLSLLRLPWLQLLSLHSFTMMQLLLRLFSVCLSLVVMASTNVMTGSENQDLVLIHSFANSFTDSLFQSFIQLFSLNYFFTRLFSSLVIFFFPLLFFFLFTIYLFMLLGILSLSFFAMFYIFINILFYFHVCYIMIHHFFIL